MTIESHEKNRQTERLTAEQPREVTQATAFAPIRKTIVEVNTATEGIQLVGIQEQLIHKRQALVAQGRVDTAQRVPFNIKAINLSSSNTTLPKGMEIAHCVEVPSIWFGPWSVDSSSDTVNAVQICKTPQSKEGTV